MHRPHQVSGDGQAGLRGLSAGLVFPSSWTSDQGPYLQFALGPRGLIIGLGIGLLWLNSVRKARWSVQGHGFGK